MSSKSLRTAAAVAGLLGSFAAAHAETVTKKGTNAAGQTCTVTVNRNADGSITTAGASGTSTAGGMSSSTSVGGSSVSVQAGGGSVSSSTTMPGSGGASASVVTVNGCTISTSSP